MCTYECIKSIHFITRRKEQILICHTLFQKRQRIDHDKEVIYLKILAIEHRIKTDYEKRWDGISINNTAPFNSHQS